MKSGIFGIVLIFVFVVSSGCASFGVKLKSFLNGGEPETQKVSLAGGATSNKLGTRYSEKVDAPFEEGNRQYRRVTRDTFEKENLTNTDSGSLWQMEGQGSYLFSQNMTRVVGDMLNINIEGEPQKQLSTKASVIQQLLKKSQRAPAAKSNPQGANTAAKAGADKTDEKKPEENKDTNQAKTDKDSEKDEKDDKDNVFTVQTIPSRIVERMMDGSYRIRGSQSFMIGKTEYRVIATGVTKSSDITDSGVDASKLLDAKFDIMSMKKDPLKESTKQ